MKEEKVEFSKQNVKGQEEQSSAEDAQEEKTDEAPKEEKKPKVSFWNKMSERKAKLNQTIEEKYPKVFKTTSYMGDVWQETFPSDK